MFVDIFAQDVTKTKVYGFQTQFRKVFQNVFSPHEKAMPGFSSSSGLKRVFESSFFVTD